MNIAIVVIRGGCMYIRKRGRLMNIKDGNLLVDERDLANYIDERQEHLCRLQSLYTELESLIRNEQRELDVLLHLQYDLWALHE